LDININTFNVRLFALETKRVNFDPLLTFSFLPRRISVTQFALPGGAFRHPW